MSGLEDVSPRTYRMIVYGIAFYFALLVYAYATDDPLGWVATQFVFGIIAIGVGAVLYSQTKGEVGPLLWAAICLVIGGVFQFAFLLTTIPILDVLTTTFVFAGIGLYVYAVWLVD